MQLISSLLLCPSLERSFLSQITISQETIAERLERRWANERKLVSQQIEAASTSQVIVLSSEQDDDTRVVDEIDENEAEEEGEIDCTGGTKMEVESKRIFRERSGFTL